MGVRRTYRGVVDWSSLHLLSQSALCQLRRAVKSSDAVLALTEPTVWTEGSLALEQVHVYWLAVPSALAVLGDLG